MKVSGLLLAFLGCAAPGFSPEDAAAWQTAAHDWNEHTRLQSSCAGQLCMIGGEPFYIVEVSEIEHDWDGATNRSLHRIRTLEDLAPERKVPVARHEMGHALGLHHTSTGWMIHDSSDPDWTADVLTECQRAGACP